MNERSFEANQTAISHLIYALLKLKDGNTAYEHLWKKGSLDRYVYAISVVFDPRYKFWQTQSSELLDYGEGSEGIGRPGEY